MQPVSYRASFTDATRPEQGADRVGTLAWKHEVMRTAKTKQARIIAFVLALATAAYIFMVAGTKTIF